MSIKPKVKEISKDFPSFDVVSGSKEEKMVGEKIRGFFEERGLEAEVFTFEAMSWREDCAVVEAGGERFTAVAMPYTPSGDVEAELLYVGYGIFDEEWYGIDASGKIVLLKWFDKKIDEVNWQYINAVKYGAEAVIFFDPYPRRRRRMVLTLSTDYRFGPGTPPYVPSVSVSYEDGMRLLKMRREKAKVRVYTETRVSHASTSYVVYAGSLEGPVFTAHLDKWLTGFTDNVLGAALVVLAAELFGESTGYIVFGSEESGAPGYSPWYWIWGSRRFAEHLQDKGVLDDLGMVINFDVLGGEKIHVSASGPDLEDGLQRLLGDSFLYGPDETIFDSFSFTMKGVPAVTFHSYEDIIPYYHTDMDKSDIVNWEAVEKAFSAATKVAQTFLSKRWKMLNYNSLIQRVKERLEAVSYLPEAVDALEVLSHVIIDDEKKARLFRRNLTRPLYHGRYEITLHDIVSAYPYLLDQVEDLVTLRNFVQNRGVSYEEVLKVEGYRIISGYEQILASVETRFWKRNIPSNQVREAYIALENIVRSNILKLKRILEEMAR